MTGTTRHTVRTSCNLCGKRPSVWVVRMAFGKKHKAGPVYLCSACKEKAEQWQVLLPESRLR